VVDTPMEEWKPEEIQAHLDHYQRARTRARRERRARPVGGPGRPDLAKIVTSDGEAARRHRRPFQEFKEWLAGYQIVDVESEARALEIAARLSAVPGPDGVPLAAADPGAAGDGASSVATRRDGGVLQHGGGAR
jgi:hypothetical protein